MRPLPLRLALAGAGLCLAVGGAGVVGSADAAGANQTITAPSQAGKSTTVSWNGTIPQGASVILVGDPLGFCVENDQKTGDRHTIEVKLPSSLPKGVDLTGVFSIDWDSPNGGVEDEKMLVVDPHGKVVADSDTGGQSYEAAPVTKLENGIYTVIACPFQNPTPKPYIGKLTIHATAQHGSVATGVTKPVFGQYAAPQSNATNAGEPSIGVNWKSGATMFLSNTTTYRVAFNDKARTSTWTNVSGHTSAVISLDPILWTDRLTGRTLVSQLLLACSATETTDDDGATWVPSQGCGPATAVDHQTIGGGPYPAETAPIGTLYQNMVFYCAQGSVAALCAKSVDGGHTFPAESTPAITTECGVLHGHLRVGPDGTVYLPASDCQGKQGVSVSTDGGLTWKVHQIPDSLSGTNDSSVDGGKDGTVYFGYADGTGHPKVAVSRDRGVTWQPSIDLGIPYGIQSTEFSEVIVGDNDRAAVAFLGSPTRGYFQGADFGKSASGDKYVGGRWDMYVAFTYDHGKTWTTTKATPDPVQRGCIWNGGGSNKCRNLLDFNDIVIDKTGRVMVGFADGCTSFSGCAGSTDVGDNKFEEHGTIVRQLTGKTLFAKYDGLLPGSKGPVTGGTKTGSGGAGGTGSSGSGSSGSGGGGLPTTGSSPWVPAAGLLLLVLAVLPWRRRLGARD